MLEASNYFFCSWITLEKSERTPRRRGVTLLSWRSMCIRDWWIAVVTRSGIFLISMTFWRLILLDCRWGTVSVLGCLFSFDEDSSRDTFRWVRNLAWILRCKPSWRRSCILPLLVSNCFCGVLFVFSELQFWRRHWGECHLSLHVSENFLILKETRIYLFLQPQQWL